MRQAVLSLSGGMDSSTVLLHLLDKGYEVTAVSFNYGQKHNIELERAQQLVDYLKENGYPIKYQEITLFGLVDLLNSNLVQGGEEVAMGIHAGDHAIYPDCRQEFRDADYKAFCEGNWDAEWVTYYTPYLDGDKYDILKDGERCCERLGLDFDEVYKRTNTSYKPDAEGKSDYKSASSVERIEAFLKLGRKDPVEYIDGWETAKKHVEQLLLNY
jgi:7-cyano-7-deazaguanine synthase